MKLSWAQFVLQMRERGVTTLLQEVNTYTTDELPMLVYAELNNQMIGVYHPRREEGMIMSKPSVNWSKRGRKFDKIKI